MIMENTSNSIAWWSKSSTFQKVLIIAFISLIVFSIFLKGENNARKKLKDCLAITGYSFTGNCQMGSIIGDATITIDKEGNSASVTYSALGSQATESGKLANLILEEGGPDNTYKIVGDWKVEGNASQGARFYFSVFADKPKTVICQISNSQFAYYDNKELITEDFLKIKELLKSSGSNNELSISKVDTIIIAKDPNSNNSKKKSEPIKYESAVEYDKSKISEDAYFKENNYKIIQMHLVKSKKDVTAYSSWLKSVIARYDSPSPFSDLTPICQDYVMDAAETNLEILDFMPREKFNKKWQQKFDVNYSNFVHLFENGDCGWGTKQIVELTHLGTLNNGEWFNVTIKGGCGENDFSETIIRVVKIIKVNNSYKIDNFLSIKDTSFS
jgi:hypothetical protein